MLRDNGRMEKLEEFGFVNISYVGLLRRQNRRWGRKEFYMSVEVWMD